MIPLSADIVDRFYTFLWPLIRIAAALMTAPVLALEAANARVRLILALVLAWLVFPLVEWPRIDPLSAEGLLAIFNQIAIGILMGLALQIVVAAIMVGGQAISSTMGLSMANLMDHNFGNVPVLSQFLMVLGVLVFLALGGHLLLIQTLVESFRVLPVGQSLAGTEPIGRLIGWSTMMFLGAVLLALPVLVTLLLVNVGVGIITRAAPSLNIFSVGFPAMMLSGFVLLLVCMSSVGWRLQWLWLQGLDRMRYILGMS